MKNAAQRITHDNFEVTGASVEDYNHKYDWVVLGVQFIRLISLFERLMFRQSNTESIVQTHGTL